MSISLALIPTAMLLKVVLFDNDYKNLLESSACIQDIELPTNYTDKDLLKKTLDEYGAEIFYEYDDTIKCKIENSFLKFTKVDGSYSVKIINASNGEKIYQDLKELDLEYKRNLQEQVYINTKNNIKKEGMEIEKEEILEDNSIVLTISC